MDELLSYVIKHPGLVFEDH